MDTGISRSAKGYCVISVYETMKTYSVEDGLTEEALVTKLRTCRCHHLFLHNSLRNNTSGLQITLFCFLSLLIRGQSGLCKGSNRLIPTYSDILILAAYICLDIMWVRLNFEIERPVHRVTAGEQFDWPFLYAIATLLACT